MNTYERITYKKYETETRSHTIYVRNPTEIPFLGTPAVTGIQVDLEAREIQPRGADERQVIIDSTLICRRTPMKLSLHYGELEEA